MKPTERNKKQTEAASPELREKNKKWPVVKRVIAVVILLAGVVFAVFNSDLCYNIFRTPHAKYEDAKVTYLSSDSVCRQKFRGYNGTLQRVGLYMDNQGRESTTGWIKVSVLNEDGTEIGSTMRPLREIKTRKYNRFLFEDEPSLDKDQEYTLVINCIDAHNPQKFGIYTASHKNKWLKEGSIDGTQLSNKEKIVATFAFRYYAVKHMAMMLGLLIFGILFALFPFGRIERRARKKKNSAADTAASGLISGRERAADIARNANDNKNGAARLERVFSRILFVAAPVVAYLIMECLSGYSFHRIFRSFFWLTGAFNLILYTVLLLVFYAIVNRTQYAAMLLWTVTFVFGLANYFVFQFRGVPVLASDILSITTALNVAGSYEYVIDISVLWAACIYAAFTGMMMSLPPYRGLALKRRVPAVCATAVAVCGAYWYFVVSDHVASLGIKDSQWKPQLTYEKNGSMLSFVTSWKYIKTQKPQGYSAKDVMNVAKNYPSDNTSEDAAGRKKLPDVIAIMNESLADLNVDGELKLSEDYLPFLHSMHENTIKGNLYVSIEGANTANSEFEFLTGNSLAHFAPRSVPYNNYVKGVVPSLTRTLKAQGYTGNNATHPYKRSGWNRANVYNSLGFSHFYSEKYYKDATFLRNFITDQSDMEQIVKDYERAKEKSGRPFYQFNVTVQNHGGYAGNRGFVDADIDVLDTKLASDEVEQYLTLAKASDDAFKYLIHYFETVSDPVIIVMFGDHQPPLSEDFYSGIFGTNMEKFSTEQTATWYSTPYVIWTNYDIREQKGVDMSANYLSSYLLQMIGADMTGYNKYLLDLREKLPVITGLFYQGNDGVFYDIDETSGYTNLIKEYAKVQYNGLFDKHGRINDFFFLEGGDYPLRENEDEEE